jgi:hypothetical protein
MEHAEIELLLDREMPHTGHKRLPERSIIRPFGKNFVDGRIVNGRLALGVVWNGQALPLHPRIQHPQNENETSPQQAAGYQNPKLEPSKQLHLDILTMQFLIRLFTALLLDVLANDFFIAMTPNSTDKVAFRPEFATP